MWAIVSLRYRRLQTVSSAKKLKNKYIKQNGLFEMSQTFYTGEDKRT